MARGHRLWLVGHVCRLCGPRALPVPASIPHSLILAMASSLRAASHRIPVSASAAALPRTPFLPRSTPARPPLQPSKPFTLNPRVYVEHGTPVPLCSRLGGGLGARSGVPRADSGVTLVTGRGRSFVSKERNSRGKVGLGGLGVAQGRGRVSTAAMAENLKNLRLDDGAAASGDVFDKVRRWFGLYWDQSSSDVAPGLVRSALCCNLINNLTSLTTISWHLL